MRLILGTALTLLFIVLIWEADWGLLNLALLLFATGFILFKSFQLVRAWLGKGT